jgi:hypothetical protein
MSEHAVLTRPASEYATSKLLRTLHFAADNKRMGIQGPPQAGFDLRLVVLSGFVLIVATCDPRFGRTN